MADAPRLGDACGATLDRTRSQGGGEAGLGMFLDLTLRVVSKGRQTMSSPCNPNKATEIQY